MTWRTPIGFFIGAGIPFLIYWAYLEYDYRKFLAKVMERNSLMNHDHKSEED